ncbi:cytochrome c biogenesis protein ResB [Streptomyces sp. CdTB01]|uniref:cytochrome c biogenesis protein ResB n=1 Tax=Streptomyces sp. CdTB01 TaxID=1725411 RepID=UPI00073AB570|nr:cytochrome c biogenesis protein ResB [Streptomyces sp. CdTB01]ALV39169.1 cytochrome C biogenesis protein [Streptomyces sp. CdTB01]
MSKTTTPPRDTSGESSGRSRNASTAEEPALGAAGAQLSTAPSEDRGVPVLGFVGWVRWCWRQLTSMRVALILLFLLSLASIPGSLVPQRGSDPAKVDQYKTDHDVLGPIAEKLQLFNVYSSVWFSAIYILLFISLIGCIVPRSWQFAGQLRGRPPAAPRHLVRLPAHTTWRTDAEPEQVLAAVHRLLKRRRYRAYTAGDAVASEKGYLREVGNLVFHVSLIVMLVAFATGQLWNSEGGKLVVEGDGFSNTLSQYDDLKSGALFDREELPPFGFTLEGFDATYERTGPQKGTPRTFQARISYWEGSDGEPRPSTITVNHPLEVGGSKVYLLGHGYAPVVTVKDGQGTIAYQGPVAFLPQDSNVTSLGVIKVPNYRDAKGSKDQLGFQGVFVPTFGGAGSGSMFSQFPALDFPVMALTAYRGDLGLDSGLPQNVYQLDLKNMKQFVDAKGNKFRKMLRPGETMTLPGGAGSLTFDGIKEWATFQVSYRPGNRLALAGALAALIGLSASLFIQRRRIWVKATPGEDGTTVVEVAGLGRSEWARLPEEVAAVALALRPDAPALPPAQDAPDSVPASADPEQGARS